MKKCFPFYNTVNPSCETDKKPSKIHQFFWSMESRVEGAGVGGFRTYQRKVDVFFTPFLRIFFSGVKGTNGMILGSGIQILEEALSKATAEGVSTPTFVNTLDIKVGGGGEQDERLGGWRRTAGKGGDDKFIQCKYFDYLTIRCKLCKFDLMLCFGFVFF